MDAEEISYIMNLLRQGTITWKGRTECLNRNRYLGLNPKTGKEVWWRDCDKCGKATMLKDKLLEVDHIKQVGPFDGSWDSMVNKVYCRQDNLQALCTSCHARKSAVENSALRFKRKNAVSEDML